MHHRGTCRLTCAAILGLTLCLPTLARAQQSVIPLYPGAAPGSEKWDWSERAVTTPAGLPMVQNVVRPELLYYPADRSKAVGAAMVVGPGGGFRTLMMSYEGVDIARRLNAIGVSAFVLKYRLLYSGPDAPRPAPRETPPPGQPRKFVSHGSLQGPVRPGHDRAGSQHGRQAMKLVRERATQFGVRPDRVGMIGFSAGGIVTTELLFGPAATRPDVVAIIYGSGELRAIPDPAPPLFLAVAGDDAMVENTLAMFTAYRNGKGVAELHVFQMGAHGFVNKGGGADHFMDRLEEWLRANKVLASK